MATRSEYEELVSDWKKITEDYDKRVDELPHNALQVERTLCWLLYKSSEANLIRKHGWTVLEFEQESETRRAKKHFSEIQQVNDRQDEPPMGLQGSERGQTW